VIIREHNGHRGAIQAVWAICEASIYNFSSSNTKLPIGLNACLNSTVLLQASLNVPIHAILYPNIVQIKLVGLFSVQSITKLFFQGLDDQQILFKSP